MNLDRLRRYRPLLWALAVLCVARVLGFAWVYTRESLQMDFAAFYSAGVSASAGLDPYKNNVDVDPRTWDGTNAYKHSRFLYPPLIATAMRPIAALPYPVAKTVWTFLSLGLIAVSVCLALRVARARVGADGTLLLTIVCTLIYPLLNFIERGQIDGWTLALIMAGFYLIMVRKHGLAGGALFALAGVIKLQCFYLFPLLLVARMVRPAVGMAVGGVAVGLLQVAVCGWPLTKQYLTAELPRISKHGESGPPEMLLNSPNVAAYLARVPAGSTLQGGTHPYRVSVLEPGGLGSLTPWLRKATQVARVPLSMSVVSVALLLIACGAVFRLLRGRVPDAPWPQFALINLFLLVILLTAPITWPMNLVWLAPLAALILFAPPPPGRARWSGCAVCAAIGLALLIVPDVASLSVLIPQPSAPAPAGPGGAIRFVIGSRYVAAMLLALPHVARLAVAGARAASADARRA